LRITYIEGESGINTSFYGFHGAVLHAVIAEGNDLAIGFGDALNFAVGVPKDICCATKQVSLNMTLCAILLA
jgi:hypothetical protein